MDGYDILWQASPNGMHFHVQAKADPPVRFAFYRIKRLELGQAVQTQGPYDCCILAACLSPKNSELIALLSKVGNVIQGNNAGHISPAVKGRCSQNKCRLWMHVL